MPLITLQCAVVPTACLRKSWLSCVNSVAVDVPAASDSGESFRSESSRLPEQVDSVRADLGLLIRSEIYDIIADGYCNSSDIFDELTSRFLDETC